MAFYTITGDDPVRFKTISEAREKARWFLSKRREKDYRMFINKNVRVSNLSAKFYTGYICAEVSKVTDPDGLVVYLYREVKNVDNRVTGHDDRFGDLHTKGPLYILKADGTLGTRVSSNTWTEPTRSL